MKLFKYIFVVGIVFVFVGVAYMAISQPAEEKSRFEESSLVPFTYDPAGLRDPFVPIIVPTFTPIPTSTPPYPTSTPTCTPIVLPDLSVELIFWSPDRPLAIINKELVEPGDSVGEVRVINIEPHAVIVVYYNKQFRLEIVGD